MVEVKERSASKEVFSKAYRRRLIWLLAGPIAWLLVSLFVSPREGLDADAIKVMAVAMWMIIWWIGEPVAIPVTSILPLFLLPITGFSTLSQAAAGYANRIIYLFMGGFIMALAIEKHNMHRRLAWGILLVLGSSPRKLLFGFMVSVGILSMWLSNTATAVMMLPIALAVLSQLPELLAPTFGKDEAEIVSRRVGTALLLGVAYAASIGGMGTLIGTPPNAVLAGAMSEQFNRELSFGRWMIIGVPVAVGGIIIAYFLLAGLNKLPAVHTPEIKKIIGQRLRELGKITPNQLIVSLIFALTAVAWMTRSWLLAPLFPKLDDAALAMGGALLMFAVPQVGGSKKDIDFILTWKDMLHLPWGILLLFGGGFSLANAFSKSGLSQWMGNQLLLLQNVPLVVLLLAVIVLMSLLTQVTSNSASTTLMMPILGALGTALGVEPLLLMGSAAMAASCAFMLPVATPPNAIVFASGKLSVQKMLRNGAWLNLIFVLLLTLVARFGFRLLLT